MKKNLTLLAIALFASSLTGIAQAAPTVLKFGYEAPRSDTQHAAATRFAALVKERSAGQIEIKGFPDSTLGSGQAMISGVRSGTIDMEMSGSPNFTGLVAQLNVLDIPFIFRDEAHAYRVLDGEVGQGLLDLLEAQGMKGLAFWEVGFRSITNSKRDINVPEDVKGLKIRTNPNPMYIEAFKLLGANPVPMPLAELYTALETRTVDAQEHPIGIVWSAKLYEVQKHLSLTKHAYTALIVVINKAKFDALPADQQQILVTAAQEAGQYQRQLNRDNEAKIIDSMRQAGVTVIENIDTAPFRAAVEQPVRQYFIDRNGDTLVKAIDAAAQ